MVAEAAPQGYYGEDGQWYAYPADYTAPQQPQGYYGEDGQWYAYPADYTAPQQPQGYYGEDGQWYAYPADYTAPQQPQGYYGEDGQWYAYPANYDAQQPQGYYGEDGQWYAYPTSDDAQAQAPAAETLTAEEPVAEAAQFEAPAPVTPFVLQTTLEVDTSALDLSAAEPDMPVMEAESSWADVEPEPAEPAPLEPMAEEVFEVADTDLAPVSAATPLPEPIIESVDMGDWEDSPAPEPEPVLAAPEPVQELGEDDFSSLNNDESAASAVPPRAAAPRVEELSPTQTLDIPATDISVLDASGHLPPSEEPVQPVSEEWESTAPSSADAWEEGDVPRAFDSDEDGLADADRMEVTASYALPSYPSSVTPPPPAPAPLALEESPTFDVSELEASPEPRDAYPAVETPWETPVDELSASTPVAEAPHR
ncbi:hypothetical protein [Archangium primigenium]|uniref:hypothetical protein n=1 Tax=[Archangium] primigenium TaxID=2792470 RepID=UPI00195CC630|nr:hypothetical protein [Archangium primigenium]MBM7119514.1 hypothetical protein [Archangium primigenium]